MRLGAWIISVLVFIILMSNSYAECQDPILEYKKCVDAKCGTGYVKQEGCADACKDILTKETECVEEEEDTCLKNSCQVTIESDFEGVSADGVSNITFLLYVSGDYDQLGIQLQPMAGETLRGKTEKSLDTVITFTPDAADKNKNYLKPQIAYAMGWCIPKKAACETEEPQKEEVKTDFTIQQPPIFFVHGIWSSPDLWKNFEGRVKKEGWQYGDIDYLTQDITKSAENLNNKIKEFTTKVNHGEYYNRKQINAVKVDIVSHSMGGIVSRYYIGSKDYKGNIRKLIMMGTPNHGGWDPQALSYIFVGRHDEALTQLSPNSKFLNDLNNQPIKKDIEYRTIAGTGWHTHTDLDKPTTWRGDGAVLVDSVRLPGVPLYCTWDTHASEIQYIMSGYPMIKGLVDSKKDLRITASDESYSIVRDLLLTGSAKKIVDCDQERYIETSYNTEGIPRQPGSRGKPAIYIQQIAHLESPATLHAYDEFGNHIGPDKNGKVENSIGDGAIYFSNSSVIEGQVINIIGDKKIRFVVVGYGPGSIGFEFTGVTANGSVMEKSFENVSIDARTQYVFDTSTEALELVKGEVEAAEAGYSWYMPLIAIFAIVFGVLLIIKSKKK